MAEKERAFSTMLNSFTAGLEKGLERRRQAAAERFKMQQAEINQAQDAARLQMEGERLGLAKKKESREVEMFDTSKSLKEADLALKKLDLHSKIKEMSSGKKLGEKDILNVNEGVTLPAMLNDVDSVLSANEDAFGPIAGRVSTMNPYDSKAQSIDAQMRIAAQRFGKYMEGGVLRKEDEDKYRKMFPQLSDTPQVARDKLQIVQRALGDKIKSDVSALEKGGYDTSAFDLSGVKQAGLPASISGTEHEEAYRWAKQNPKDPRATKIMQKLQGLQ